MSIASRKSEHIKICLNEEVQFKTKTTGFEEYDFIHCALPEMSPEDVDTEIELFGKKLSFPFFIGAITGGWKGAEKINKSLAQVCDSEDIGIEVGSQRSIIEDKKYINSYKVVRNTAPHSLIIGNVGAFQIVQYRNLDIFKRLVDVIQADALTVHLNPLQEILQTEEEFNFKGVLAGIERLVRSLEIPVIIKEVGCGISTQVARQLADAGVKYINIAGAGGTSWAGVESFRNRGNLAEKFWDWGIPTAKSIIMVKKVKGIKIIASGGIRDGIAMAKALALGSDCCSSALPVLKILHQKGQEGLANSIRQWKEELTLAMLLTGSCDLKEIKSKKVLMKRIDNCSGRE
ncbi:MAG: type 2 isopentenyl-diphosphate Delta-isomerase [bacterium]